MAAHRPWPSPLWLHLSDSSSLGSPPRAAHPSACRTAQGLPFGVNRATLKELRSQQFGKFSESVQLGLRQFGQKKNDKGPRTLYSILRSRYGDSRQAKLQLAILFSEASLRLL